jgi:hypothetical protein
LEQLNYNFGFINPDLVEHVLIMDPMAEGGDDPKRVDLWDGIEDVAKALHEMAQRLVLSLDVLIEFDLRAGALGCALEVCEEVTTQFAP